MATKSSRRNIIRDVLGDRYLLTSRRIVQLDSEDAKEGTPWYALNKEIREVAANIGEELPADYITVYSRSSKSNPVIVRVLVKMGTVSPLCTEPASRIPANSYHLGCGYFDAKTFSRILKNAGVKTIQKAMAAKAGA